MILLWLVIGFIAGAFTVLLFLAPIVNFLGRAIEALMRKRTY